MFYRLLSRLIECLIILLSATIVAVVTIEVFLRYIFGLSLIFTEELARYLMVWIVFLGAAIAIRDDSHIRISVLVKRLSPRMSNLARLIAYGLTVTFLAVIIIEGVKILPRQLYQMCVTIETSIFYFYLAIPVGSILMIIFLLPKIMDEITRKSEGAEPAEERRL